MMISPADSALRNLWQSVVIRKVSPTVIEFELREPYGAFLDATTTGILPAHLLADVSAKGLGDTEFNRAPVGTGPFIVEPGQNWERDGLFLLTPNPDAWPQGTRLENLGFRFFESEDALVDAFERGQIQAINDVTTAMLPAVAQLPNVRLFSAPASQYTSLLFNLGDKGSAATRSQDVRRSVAYALNRERIVDRSLHGQGIALGGPYLPSSWAYRPESQEIGSSNPISATVGLDASGWQLVEGSAVRQNGETALLLRFLVLNTPTNRAVAEGNRRPADGHRRFGAYDARHGLGGFSQRTGKR